MSTVDHTPEDLRDMSDAPTWHVVAIDSKCAIRRILAVYPAQNLAAAQEFARRTDAQAGMPVTRLHQVRWWAMPRVGDLISNYFK